MDINMIPTDIIGQVFIFFQGKTDVLPEQVDKIPDVLPFGRQFSLPEKERRILLEATKEE